MWRSILAAQESVKEGCRRRIGDGNLIKRIPLTRRERKDSWFWLFDDVGHFTLKSCYRILQGGLDTPDTHFWKKLWSLKLPGKVMDISWRVCTLCQPTTTRLSSKKVQIDTMCQWCRVYHETDVHLLFDCAFANAVWIDIGLKTNTILPDDIVFDVLRRMFVSCSWEKCGSVALVCSSLWNKRNKWIWDKVNVWFWGESCFKFVDGMEEGLRTTTNS